MLCKKMKQAWADWLNRTANQNKAAFGSEPLDCCRVGRENHKKNKQRKNEKDRGRTLRSFSLSIKPIFR